MSITVTKDNLYSLNLDGISRIKIKSDLTNSHLEYLVRNYNLDNIDELIIFGNNHITSIPILPNLTTLNCGECANLSNIPILPSLTSLNCGYCSSLNNIQILPNLTFLDCSFCSNLTNIPNLPNLNKLYCNSCTNLSNIPLLPNLTKLFCSCTNLTYIPLLPNLKNLQYYGCKNLNLYTIPLNLIHNDYLTIELLTKAIEYNEDNIKYLKDLNKSKLSIELINTINEIITSSYLVKPAK